MLQPPLLIDLAIFMPNKKMPFPAEKPRFRDSGKAENSVFPESILA